MTKPKWYHYLLATASSDDPEARTASMHSPTEIAEAYADKDKQALSDMHNEQSAYDRAANSIKGKVAATALGYGLAPSVMPWVILGSESIANIANQYNNPGTYSPTSYAGYTERIADPNRHMWDKLDDTVNYGISWIGQAHMLRNLGKYGYDLYKRGALKPFVKSFAKQTGGAVGVQTAAELGMGLSGFRDTHPVLAETASHALGWFYTPKSLYKENMTNIANRFRRNTPTVTDEFGNILSQHKILVSETKPGEFKYKGTSVNGGPYKKDIFTRLGAYPKVQPDTRFDIQALDGSTRILNGATGEFTVIPSFSSTLSKQKLLKP